MSKTELFRPSLLVNPALHTRPLDNELGSLGRAKRRRLNLDRTVSDLIDQLTEIHGVSRGLISIDTEREIRERVDGSLNKRFLAKKAVLSHFGLELTKKDQKKFEREAEEVTRYPGIDLFCRESRAKVSISLLAEYLAQKCEVKTARAWSNEDLLCVAWVLVMILHGVPNPNLAKGFMLNAIDKAYSIKNVAMVPLEFDSEDCANPALTHKLILSRAVLFLLKEMRRRFCRDSAEKILGTKKFDQAMSALLNHAGIVGFHGGCEGLEEVGAYIHTLSELYVPVYLRDLFEGRILSTPISPLSDFICTTQQYPKAWPDKHIPKEVSDRIDAVLTDVGEGQISDGDFYSGLTEKIALVESMSCGGEEQARLTLAEGVMSYLKGTSELYQLTGAQKLLGLFLLYMGLVGIPESVKDASVGTLSTLKTYLSHAKQVVFEVYGRQSDIETTDENWAEVLRKLRGDGAYNVKRADRLNYFLQCMDQMEVLEPPPPAVIYEGLKRIEGPACSELIHLKAYGRALSLVAKHFQGGDKWRRLFVLTLMYRGGLRISEAYNIKFNQVLVSEDLIDVYVGGRGGPPPKSKAAHRWSSLLGELTELERWAIDEFVRMKGEEGCAPTGFVFRCADKKVLQADRARLQRSLNDILKVATGRSTARCHDCRKTNINHVILSMLKLDEKDDKSSQNPMLNALNATARFEHLWHPSFLPNMNIPKKWRIGGARHAYFGDAVASRFGHSSFEVTVKNYLVYGPEFYQFYWSRIGLEKDLKPAMHALSFGELNTGHKRRDFLERQAGTKGIVKPDLPFKTPPESLAEKPRKLGFPSNVAEVALLMSGRLPDHISHTDVLLGDVSSKVCEIQSLAAAIASEIKYLSMNPGFEEGASWTPHAPFFDIAIPREAISRYSEIRSDLDTTIYSEDGLWLQSYVVEEKKQDEFSERLVMRSVEDLGRLIEHLSELGFSPEKISVEAMCGSRASQLVEEKGANLVEVTRRRLRKFVFWAYEAASIVTLARDIDSKIQLNKRFHQLAFVEYVYQRYLEKCGRDS
jgi:hypothetical protein